MSHRNLNNLIFKLIIMIIIITHYYYSCTTYTTITQFLDVLETITNKISFIPSLLT